MEDPLFVKVMTEQINTYQVPCRFCGGTITFRARYEGFWKIAYKCNHCLIEGSERGNDPLYTVEWICDHLPERKCGAPLDKPTTRQIDTGLGGNSKVNNGFRSGQTLKLG